MSKDNLKNIFVANPNLDKNAYLNWRFDKEDTKDEKFIKLGEAYFEVAEHLIDICIDDGNENYKLDGWIFPILFDIYQGLELYLKAYSYLLNPQKAIKEGGHDIQSICGEIFNKLAELKIKNSKNEEIYENFKVVRKFIIMMYDNTTKDVSYLRYPVNNQSDDFFYVGGQRKINEKGEVYFDNVTIDIEKLKEWTMSVHGILQNHFYYWDSHIHPEKYI